MRSIHLRSAIVLPALAIVPLTLGLGACGGDDERVLPAGSRDVTIPSGDAELDATVANPGVGRAIVISHGANGRRVDFDPIVEAFAAEGWFVVAYDARRDRRADDLAAAVGWARAEGAADLVLLGGSFGACLSVVHAVEHDAVAVIGLSTAPECDGSAVSAAESFGSDLPARFVVARDDDGFVPTAMALADATGTEAIVADGDAHGSGVTDDHPEIVTDLVAFANQVVPAAAPTTSSTGSVE